MENTSKIKLDTVQNSGVNPIVPRPKATLTVTTCYPFDYIGDAKQRYVLEAELISSQLK